MQVHILPSSPEGCIRVPSSKSFAHRAVLCAALSSGRSRIDSLDYNRDINATLDAAKAIGCSVTRLPNEAIIVPLGGFATLHRPIDCGESGSTLRFLIPVFSLTGQPVHFIGHGRLMERPQKVYADLLPAHGTMFTQDSDGICISGGIRPGVFTLPGNVSSQFVSGLLFALPLLDKPSRIIIDPPPESRSYIEITRSVLASFGIRSEWIEENELFIPGRQLYHRCNYTVEGDYSQAAFPAVLGSIRGHTALTGLAENTLQGDAVIVDILKRSGADVRREGDTLHFSEGALSAHNYDIADCPDLGPILMVLGTCCKGRTMLKNAGRLRLKESDRIAAMQEELAKFGAQVSASENTVTIRGCALHAPEVPLSCHNDHRIAMSLAVLALAKGFPAVIDGAEAVEKSWPSFWEDMRRLGANVEVRECSTETNDT